MTTSRDVLGEAIARSLHPSTSDDRAAAWDDAVSVFVDTDLTLLDKVFPMHLCDFDHADAVLQMGLANLRAQTGGTAPWTD